MEEKKSSLRTNRQHFAMVTPQVADALKGKPAAMLVFVQLALHANYTTKQCFPSLSRLMETTGLSKNTVIKGIREIQDAGFLLKEAHANPQYANLYTILEAQAPSSKFEQGVVQNLNRGSAKFEPQREGSNENHKNEKDHPPTPLPDIDLSTLTPQSARNHTNRNCNQSASDTGTSIRSKQLSPTETVPIPLALRAELREPTIGELAEAVMQHFRETTGREFTCRKAAEGVIRRVQKAKGTLSDIPLVVLHRTALWGKDETMRKYLRPETVFRASHWEGYVIDAKEWDALDRPEIRKSGKQPKGLADGIMDYLGASA